jgi:hypothetical protein
MAKIVTQLGKSRKYANGSIHENATGKFQVLDRYLSDEGIVMLKLQWLSGDKEGEIEDNKEENMNASIYKYEQSRGLIGKIEENKDVVTLGDIYEIVVENQRILKWYEEDRRAVTNILEVMENKLISQGKLIAELATHLNDNTKTLAILKSGDNKRDEVIKEIETTVERNTDLIQGIMGNLEIFQTQQKMMDKLLEKI